VSAVGGAPGPDRYIDTAARIGERLLDEAVWHETRCTWLGDDMDLVDHTWQVVHQSVGGELYSGTSGIARFLAGLWSVTGDPALRSTAEAALRQALWAVERGKLSSRLGLYDGATGVAWTAIELGEALESEDLSAAGSTLSRQLASEVLASGADPPPADLVTGAAGAILAFLAMAGPARDEQLTDASIALGDGLLAAARRSAFGWSWNGSPGMARGEANLCGLGHGASGVAYALQELYAATGDGRYLEAANAGVRYERGWFDRPRGNWPDLRGASQADLAGGPAFAFPAFWCHGAVGIGLVRLRAHQLTGDRVALAEAGAALAAARGTLAALMPAADAGAHPFETNFSLCHGLMGIAELLVFAYEVLGVEEHLETARWIGDQGIQRAAEGNARWSCGVPGGDEAPGLMLGLAGIGSAYLRLHDPRAAPALGLLGGWPASGVGAGAQR